MKRYALYCMAVMAMLNSCKNNNTHVSPLTASNLTSTFVSLNADSAYTLKTPKGAVIKIAKNTFDVSANTKVKLEIKEAYTMQDILLAGLSTTSNSKLLKSGGMIYINATTDDKEVNFLKPINVSIPTKAYDDNMQLFKGEAKDDSTINWVDPQPLDSSPVAKKMAIGKALFLANCSNCHKPAEDFTGPPLAGSRQREPNPEWAYQFTDHSNTMVNTDPYAKALKQKYGSVMTQQNLTKEEIKAILDYCDSISLLNPVKVEANTQPISDSTKSIAPCGYDTVYYSMPDTSIQILPGDTTSIDTTSANNITISQLPTYQFNIDRSGWYNIDCFIDANLNAVSPVKLSATITPQKDIYMDIYLCIPGRKLLADGYKNNDNKFVFYSGSDSIQLILNDNAFIFAVGSDSSGLYYGITKFTVQPQQNIAIAIKPSSKEEVLSSIKKNDMDDVKIDLDKIDTKIDTISYIVNPDSTNGVKEMHIIPKPCNGDYPQK